MGKLVERFAQVIPSLSHAEKHVLYFIESNLTEAKDLSLTEMAKKINVSTTTVVRMCQKLGLQGFSEFKFILRAIEEDSIPDEEDFIKSYQQYIQNTLLNISLEDVNSISQLMTKADKVIIVAVGLSKMIGEYLSKLLMQVNISTLYVYESHIINLLLDKISNKDLVIFISSSGETQTIVKVAEKLKYQHRKTVAITNTPDSTLANLASISLSANVQSVQFAGYDLTYRSTLMMLVDILFKALLLQNVHKTHFQPKNL